MEPNAIQRDTGREKVAGHPVDRVRFGFDRLGPEIVVKEKSVGVGGMRPSQRLLDVRCAFAANTRGVGPEGVPGIHLSGEVFHDGVDMIRKDRG